MSTEVDSLINKFGGVTESYKFYNNEVELAFDKIKHVYLLVNNDGQLEEIESVTKICHILDKSQALMGWACKVMANKLLASIPKFPVINIAYDKLVGLINDSKSAHKEKLEEAGDIGHQAHNWIEAYIKGLIFGTIIPYLDDKDEKVINCCKAALDWMHKHNVRWISTERKIYSKEYKYAGTADGLCICDSCDNVLCCPDEFKDRLSLPDWKSSNYLYIEYLFQTAAYQYAIQEEDGIDIIDRWVIRLGKTDGAFEAWHLGPETYIDDLNGFLACLRLSRNVAKVEARMKEDKVKMKEYKKLTKVKKSVKIKKDS